MSEDRTPLDLGRIGECRLTILMRHASIIPWGQSLSSRSSVPPEAITNWAFHTPDGRELTLRMWLRDAERDEAVGRCSGSSAICYGSRKGRSSSEARGGGVF